MIRIGNSSWNNFRVFFILFDSNNFFTQAFYGSTVGLVGWFYQVELCSWPPNTFRYPKIICRVWLKAHNRRCHSNIVSKRYLRCGVRWSKAIISESERKCISPLYSVAGKFNHEHSEIKRVSFLIWLGYLYFRFIF